MFDNLRKIREDNDLTQKDISELLSVSRQNYSRWETYEKIIPLKHLVSLCNYYKVSLDYISELDKNNNYKKIILNKKKVGKKLKEFRKNNSLTQTQLANFLNTTHSTISAYESGKTLILTTFAYQICKKYNVSLDWLCS